MLIVLWLSEVVFLNDIYKLIKTNSITNAGNDIVEEIDRKHIDKMIQKVARDNGACVTVTDDFGNILYKGDFNNSCATQLSLSEFTTRINKALENRNTYVDKTQREEHFVSEILPNFDVKMGTRIINEIKYTGISMKDNQTYFVFVDAVITPLSETVDVIRKVIFFVTLIMSVLAVIIGVFLSKFITKPIIQIHEQSKHLLNPDVKQETVKGYKEVNELSKTLQETSIELQKVETLRNELIANISHDLRTPLTMMGGYAEMMGDLPNENNPENLKIILDETRHLTRLVNDVLDLSKMKSGNQALNLVSFSITELIEQLCHRLNAMKTVHGVKIEFIHSEDIHVEADEMKISQVLYNLISNAINYSGESKVVEIKQTRMNNEVLIEVIDHGPGIEEEALSTIWERYYRSNNNHVRSSIGSGLGLSIVREALIAHQANYGVHSTVGVGSTFYFSLKVNQ